MPPSLITLSQRKSIFRDIKWNFSGGNVILRWIFHAVLWFPLHFTFYRGNLDNFSDSLHAVWGRVIVAKINWRVPSSENWSVVYCKLRGVYVSESKGVNTIVVYCVSILVYFTLCLRLFNAFWKTVWMRYLENISYPIHFKVLALDFWFM